MNKNSSIKNKIFLPILFILISTYTKILSQENIHKKNDSNFWRFVGITPINDTNSSKKDGIYVAPLLFYTPDTRWAFGLAGAYIFHINDKRDDISNYSTRASYVRFTSSYTQNKQSDIWSEWSVFTNREKYFFKGEFRMRNFPDKFYGIGNDTQKDDNEIYSYNLISFKFLGLKQLKKGFFLGLDYHYTKEYNFSIIPNGTLSTGGVIGNMGGVGSALGLVSILDERDNVMNPHKGQFIEFSSYFYRNVLGGSFNFTVLNGEYRKYFSLKQNHILAFQTKTRISIGEVPFLEMSQIGNDDLLRGYPRNRFRDKNLFATQIEYRFPLFWRFGMTTFAGFGDVFEHLGDLKITSTKYTLGAGLRFLMNSSERLNIRVDYGRGSEGGYFYVSFTEAF
jgi:outer membrane protein assembly factor BamA